MQSSRELCPSSGGLSITSTHSLSLIRRHDVGVKKTSRNTQRHARGSCLQAQKSPCYTCVDAGARTSTGAENKTCAHSHQWWGHSPLLQLPPHVHVGGLLGGAQQAGPHHRRGLAQGVRRPPHTCHGPGRVLGTVRDTMGWGAGWKGRAIMRVTATPMAPASPSKGSRAKHA